jgi:NTE family protein
MHGEPERLRSPAKLARRWRFGGAMPSTLSSVLGFSELPEADLARLRAKAVTLSVPRGAELVRQGEPADNLYLVLSGRFLVKLEHRRAIIAEIGPGEPIGELAFFGGGRRTATVIAARDSEVLKLTREAYTDIVRDTPTILPGILAAMAKRLAAATAAAPGMRRKRPRSVALLAVGDETALPVEFVDRLTQATAGAGIAIVDERALPPSVFKEDAHAIAAHLARIEQTHALVLVLAERTQSAYARVALGNADELVLITRLKDSARAPDPLEEEAAALFSREHRSLLLWRESAAEPIAGTAAWLKGRDLGLHHHVALDAPADFARWLRFLKGEALGLVLSGGAALGCAHLGVARALEDFGVAVDFLGGASAGAAMAAALAMQRRPDDILAATEDIFVKNRAMRRFTLPRHSLLDHARLDDLLRQHYGATLIEDMPVNYFAVSASLSENEMRVHRRGLVWEAIRASAAIPGMLPPFITAEGEVLVDGSIVDNLPIGVMRELKIGPNIAVTFGRGEAWRVEAPYTAFPTRWGLLRDVLLRRKRPAHPSLLTILMKGFFFSAHRLEQRISHDGDLFLVPCDTSGIGILDWHRGRELADAAYSHVRGLLQASGSLKALFEAAAADDAARLAMSREAAPAPIVAAPEASPKPAPATSPVGS